MNKNERYHRDTSMEIALSVESEREGKYYYMRLVSYIGRELPGNSVQNIC